MGSAGGFGEFLGRCRGRFPENVRPYQGDALRLLSELSCGRRQRPSAAWGGSRGKNGTRSRSTDWADSRGWVDAAANGAAKGQRMPIVRIQLAEGRSGQEKAALMKAVTEAIHTTLDAPLPTIHVMVQEIPAEDIMVAGETLTSTPKTERI